MPARFLRSALPVFLYAYCIQSAAFAQTTERVSVGPSGVQGNSWCYGCDISSDGRVAAFRSLSTNLVSGGTNGFQHIFAHDRQTGATTLISSDSTGMQGNRASYDVAISGSGRFVAFMSDASNLVIGDTNGLWDVFVKDRESGVTTLVSSAHGGGPAHGRSRSPAISADGNTIAFSSGADNLVPGLGTIVSSQIFVRNLHSGVTEIVSLNVLGLPGSTGHSGSPAISADGRFITFDSLETTLVFGDLNGTANDIFVYDRLEREMELVSAASTGIQGNSWSVEPTISADGQIVAFESNASNLVAGDTNNEPDVFVHDRQTGATTRISVSSTGIEGNGWSRNPHISASGRFVAFESKADNLVPFDSNGSYWDGFIHDLVTGETLIATVNSAGLQGDLSSYELSVTSSGSTVAYLSEATNMVPGDSNNRTDVFVHDRGAWAGSSTGTIVLTAPFNAQTGAPMSFCWFAAPPNSQYWLIGSLNLNGSLVGGHAIDLGPPIFVLASNFNSASGSGTFVLPSVPAVARGRTAYFEVAARDALGGIFDSNVVTTEFQ